MFIDLTSRDVFDSATSTAESFKSWDTCMDNKTCKIVAIVGIVLAVLVALWILTTVFRCCFYGFSCMEACCSCFTCCCRNNKQQQVQQIPVYTNTEKVHPYDNVNMYPQNQMNYNHPQNMNYNNGVDYNNQPQQAYFPQSNYRGYEPVETEEYGKTYRHNL